MTGKRPLLARASGKLIRYRALTVGNDKLGSQIHVFSIPAGGSCPGRSKTCERVCYAKRNRYQFVGVQSALDRNWAVARRGDFAVQMIAEIRRRHVSVVRVHSAGDFFSARYIRAWTEIARSCDHVTFFAYTRSWRVRRLRSALASLAEIPNVRLWYSADRDTGLPTELPPGVRIAWLQVEEGEEVPAGIELVFRVKQLRQEPVRRISLGLVCPSENGATKTTCGACGHCFKEQSATPLS